MQSIISNMGTAYYDRVKDAIVFIFKEFSSIYAYRDSLDLAISLAVNHKTNNWFFDKTQFSASINSEVLTELLAWAKRCCKVLTKHDIHSNCRVSVLASSDSLSDHYFQMLNQKLQTGYANEHTEVAFFKDRKRADDFLDVKTKEALSHAG